MQQKFAGLNKEFKRKDVERMRNLIQGKANSSSETQVGYKKKTIRYKEGDVWTENKKTWTIKKGIKQTISKLDKIKKEVFIPLCCPKCSKVIKSRLDKDNYKVHKKELKSKNSLDIVNDMESFLLNAVNSTNEGFVSEDGHVERWVGGINKEKITKEIIKGAKMRRKHILKELNGQKEASRTN